MLARASSDAGARLRRSKSTSTVHRTAPPLVEPLDLDVAQQHAIAAATAAFARAQAQGVIDRKASRSVDLIRSKSTASRKSLRSQGSHFPPRELTARSVPGQRATQSSSTHRLSTTSVLNTEKFPSFDLVLGSDRPLSSIRPLSTQPSVTFSDNGRPASQPKSHRQSAASSIASQQIRKARSMYYARSVQTGSPIARPPAKYLTTPPPISTSPAFDTGPATYIPTRSTGPSPLAVPQVPVAVAPDETIDEARDKYLQDFQQRSIKHEPSLFLAPFKKRRGKSKDRSKRISSIAAPTPPSSHQVTDDSVIDITVSDFIPQADAKDKRSFSGSLKRKIRKVFRRTSNKSPSLPVQQIEASREYFGVTNTTFQNFDGHIDIPSPDEDLLQRVHSRTPPIDVTRPRLISPTSRSSSRGSAHSNRSLHSDADISHTSGSRVTSWGTSASGETLTQRAIKRLTVIHEAKDSIGSITDQSASASTKRKSLPLPALLAFKDPIHMESLPEEASTPSVDPKRVFSALMREIDASKSAEAPFNHSSRTPGAESDVFESSKTKELYSSQDERSGTGRDLGWLGEQSLSLCRPASAAARSVQSKKSSIKSFGQAIRSTIRTVTPADHRSSPCLDQAAKPLVEANAPFSDALSQSQSGREDRTTIFKGLSIPKKKGASTTHHTLVETTAPTAEQIELRVAKAKSRWQTALNESATPQFPRETDRLYTMVNFAQPQSPDRVSATYEPLVPPKSPAMQLAKSIQTPMSPSVYSRNTDGFSILPNDSVMTLSTPCEHERTHDEGSAVILTSQSVRSYTIGTPSPNRPSSTRSSRDWKAWLSHEVSGIETTSHENIAIHGQYTTPFGRHTLNSAQAIRTSHTGSEDTTVIVRESFEASTPRAQHEDSTPTCLHDAKRRADTPKDSDRSSTRAATALECVESVSDTFKHGSPNQTALSGKLETSPQISAPTFSTPRGLSARSTSTPSSSSSSSPPPFGTSKSARMNDRFPFLNTGRQSSSNNSSISRRSKASTDSVESSLRSPKMTPRPEVVYSDVSAPATGSTTQHAPSTAVKKAEVQRKDRENITPPSVGGHKRPQISLLGFVPRPKSLQPLSSVALNKSPPNMAQPVFDKANSYQPKCDSSSTGTAIARPSLRVIIRPLSPEKLSRRPRSAFDLRDTPAPRPASEYRRSVLHDKPSSRSAIFSIEPESQTGVDGRDSPSGAIEREGSVTPGQRMAERFLKERKSTTVLERGVTNSTGKLLRQDTPAFL